ncbi:MAG: putative glycolipid-binding domain-containing protein, partial [Steroidobacteraceae bacterium]
MVAAVNSLPVIRDGLLEAGPPRDYVMRWVDVPSMKVSLSQQRYEPLGGGVVRFRAGDFVSDITFDPLGFVLSSPGIGKRAETSVACASDAATCSR